MINKKFVETIPIYHSKYNMKDIICDEIFYLFHQYVIESHSDICIHFVHNSMLFALN